MLDAPGRDYDEMVCSLLLSSVPVEDANGGFMSAGSLLCATVIARIAFQSPNPLQSSSRRPARPTRVQRRRS